MTTQSSSGASSAVRLTGLSPRAFEHPADRAALEALRATPGLDRMIRWASSMGAERIFRLTHAAHSLKVGPSQCARLYADLREACAILDVREPDLYLGQSPNPAAFSTGIDSHAIYITTAMVDLLSDDERMVVLAHELGHIKSEHMLYHTMVQIGTELMSEAVSFVALPAMIVSEAITFGLRTWSRKSELTADRASLLCVQQPDLVVSAMLKLVAGSRRFADDLNPAEFLMQAERMEDVEMDAAGIFYRLQALHGQLHPMPMQRAREISAWSKSDQYRRILRGEYERTDPDSGRRACSQCGAAVSNPSFLFCPDCGSRLADAARA